MRTQKAARINEREEAEWKDPLLISGCRWWRPKMRPKSEKAIRQVAAAPVGTAAELLLLLISYYPYHGDTFLGVF